MNTPPQGSFDPAEIAKFDALAARFWDESADFKPLHRLNPVRAAYIQQRSPLAGRRAIDIGCGGGLLAEALCRAGAQVTAVDRAPGMIEVARLHAAEAGLSIDYRCTDAEQLVNEAAGSFDVVCCMEMLEHVPDPAAMLVSLAQLLKPGGDLFVSTLNRTPKAFALAIVGAEYVLRLLPRGTHEYARFIKPSELARWARAARLQVLDQAGIAYDVVSDRARLTTDVSVNYLVHLRASVAT